MLLKAPSRKTFKATILAAVLAVSSIAVTPARAAPDGEDFIKGAIGIIALGALISKLEKDRNRRTTPSRAPTYRDHDPLRHQSPYYQPPRHDPPRGHAHGHANRALPSQCMFDVRTRDGWQSVYGRNCLDQVGVRVDRLPRDCAFEVRTNYGRNTVYSQRCLVRNGYRVEARRY